MAHVSLGNTTLKWVDSLKYLGIMFLAGSTPKVDACYIRRKFFTACNGILSCSRSVDEFVKLGLVKAFCLPLLTYCLGALDMSATCIRQSAFSLGHGALSFCPA